MPAVQTRPRHAAPRERRTLLLPGVLLLASGAAFGGLAVLPAAADVVRPPQTRAPATTTVELAALAAPANVELLSALSKGLAVANTPTPPAPPAPKPPVAPAPRPAPAKASRNRAPAPAPATFVRPGIGRFTSGFGRRWGRLHAGIDLASGIGSPIRAVTAGVVQSAGNEGGYGRAIRLQHSDGTVTVYGHMSALLVSAGQRVTAGQQIGREGNTGHSTGPHLHFEVRINDIPINPIPWLRQHGIIV